MNEESAEESICKQHVEFLALTRRPAMMESVRLSSVSVLGARVVDRLGELPNPQAISVVDTSEPARGDADTTDDLAFVGPAEQKFLDDGRHVQRKARKRLPALVKVTTDAKELLGSPEIPLRSLRTCHSDSVDAVAQVSN